MITAINDAPVQEAARAASPASALLRLSSVTKRFGDGDAEFWALKGIDMAVERGEFLAITGESGSGKSTMLSILGGISAPTAGNVAVEGIDIYGLPIERLADFRREYIGFVFQQFHLMPYLSALENVMLPLVVAGVPDKEQRWRAEDAMSRVGLADKCRNLPSELSGGQQQRVAIARALVNEPPVILADEPTGNLDTKTGAEIFSLFGKLNASGETVIIVTHNPELAGRTGRVIRLRDGLVDGLVE